MFKNYFKIAIRSLYKSKAYTFINIFGLSTGITCCILIATFVIHELSYDKFQQKGSRIARVIMEYSMGGNVNKGNYTSTKVGPSFKENFPEVENFTRMTGSAKIVRLNDKVFIEKRFVYADSTFFNLFSFDLIRGDYKTALSGPNNVILTQSAAKKYFGDIDPVGKVIKVSSSEVSYMVTGLMADCPENSQIKFDFLASFSSLGIKHENSYWNANYTTYLLLKDESNIQSLQGKIPSFMKKEMSDFNGGDYLTYLLEPFYDVHLYSEYPGFEHNGSITYVYIFAGVALLILAIACFTFVNLCTAKSVERAKEIGVRKVSGAFKRQIFWQFIGESALMSILSTVISFLAAVYFLPVFGDLMGRKIPVNALFSPSMLFVTGLIVMSISFLAGSYPALVLSSFNPVKVLKGVFKNTGSGLVLQKALFVFQFVISVFLIICSVIMQTQLNYFQNKKLGFEKDHVLVLPMDSKVIEKYAALKTEMKKNPGVRYVSKADFEPCNIMGGYSMYKPGMPSGKMFSVFAGGVDEEYVKTCGINVMAGTDITEKDVEAVLTKDYKDRYFHFILNESAAKQFGWTPNEAIGKKMFLDESRPGEVKAVVKDFHFSSLHNPIKPLVLFPGDYGNKMFIKITGSNINQSVSEIEKSWKTVIAHRPFEYTFLDENYKALYNSEMRIGKAINVFTVLAILLAVLGLFGLSSYSIQQRTKEIGILKVLGAPIYQIVIKLSKNFLVLVVYAVVIAFPIAWWSMYKWLQDFSYRIEISPWIFFISGVVAIAIAFFTVGVKAMKAASVNPIKNLRTE